MAKKYFFVLILTLVLSGCATVQLIEGQPGSIQNPIIDSNITLEEALRKPAPPEFK
jgi:uncharacterized protein YceK